MKSIDAIFTEATKFDAEGEAYFDKSQAKAELLKLVLEAVPEERVGTDKIPLDNIERGYNLAIQDTIKAVRRLFNE